MAIVNMTKQNDVYKRELIYSDTTVEALIQKIAPKDNEVKMMHHLLEEVTCSKSALLTV